LAQVFLASRPHPEFAIGPLLVGWVVGNYSINYVFVGFGAVRAIGGVICLLFAIETKGRVLEELSP
jgi:putative MFS transporter